MNIIELLDEVEQRLYASGYSKEKDPLLFGHLLAVRDLLQVGVPKKT